MGTACCHCHHYHTTTTIKARVIGTCIYEKGNKFWFTKRIQLPSIIITVTQNKLSMEMMGIPILVRQVLYIETTPCFLSLIIHYNDVIMGSMASQITSLAIVYSAIYWGADQRKHQSAASLAFVRGILRGPVNSPLKWPGTRKMFPFDDVIMNNLELTIVCELMLTQLRWESSEIIHCSFSNAYTLKYIYRNKDCCLCKTYARQWRI